MSSVNATRSLPTAIKARLPAAHLKSSRNFSAKPCRKGPPGALFPLWAAPGRPSAPPVPRLCWARARSAGRKKPFPATLLQKSGPCGAPGGFSAEKTRPFRGLPRPEQAVYRQKERKRRLLPGGAFALPRQLLNTKRRMEILSTMPTRAQFTTSAVPP